MLTFCEALHQKLANSSSLKFSVSAIIDDAETVSADLQRTYNENMKNIINCIDLLNIQWACSPSAALLLKLANPPSLKLFVSVSIDDRETICAGSQRANVGDMKKIINCINPLNIQWGCSPSVKLYVRKWQIPPLWSCLSVIIDYAELVSADSQRANVRDMKKLIIASIPWL